MAACIVANDLQIDELRKDPPRPVIQIVRGDLSGIQNFIYRINRPEAETEHIAVQTADVVPHATVDFAVSVERGRVRISFVDSQGDTESEEASPGDPATGSVRVQLNPLNQITFDLEPVGGEASGVEYHLSFVCDCMP